MQRGPKPKASSEICDLCLELRATRGMALEKIAEILLKEHGIASKDDPTLPVHKTTVLKYINRGRKRLTKEQIYRRELQEVLVKRELDGLQEFIYEAIDLGLVGSLDDRVKLSDAALRVLHKRAEIFDLYPAKRKLIEFEQDTAAANRAVLDSETDHVLVALENMVQESKERRWGRRELSP